mmetsp:Transcript_20085/g.80130  ORF Transcript_20085/g.80130 Transcript_20085/m.80130 type:complete len:204 (+) Transcript_20085:311-922(+)
MMFAGRGDCGAAREAVGRGLLCFFGVLHQAVRRGVVGFAAAPAPRRGVVMAAVPERAADRRPRHGHLELALHHVSAHRRVECRRDVGRQALELLDGDRDDRLAAWDDRSIVRQTHVDRSRNISTSQQSSLRGPFSWLPLVRLHSRSSQTLLAGRHHRRARRRRAAGSRRRGRRAPTGRGPRRRRRRAARAHPAPRCRASAAAG